MTEASATSITIVLAHAHGQLTAQAVDLLRQALADDASGARLLIAAGRMLVAAGECKAALAMDGTTPRAWLSASLERLVDFSTQARGAAGVLGKEGEQARTTLDALLDALQVLQGGG